MRPHGSLRDEGGRQIRPRRGEEGGAPAPAQATGYAVRSPAVQPHRDRGSDSETNGTPYSGLDGTIGCLQDAPPGVVRTVPQVDLLAVLAHTSSQLVAPRAFGPA